MRNRSNCLCLAFLVVGLVAETVGAEPPSKRPNIILILADDLGFSDLGCYGSEIATPNLDALAAGGLRFTQFYNAARCCPSRAALLAGQYPHAVGVGHMCRDLGRPGYQAALSDGCITIAEALRQGGYDTLMSGKWHVGMSAGHRPLDRGFDRYFGILSGACSYFRPERHRMLMLDDRQIEPDDPRFYLTDAVSDHAVDYIEGRANSSKPFFLYVAYTAPHAPLHALPEDIARYRGKYGVGWDELRERRYRRMIELGIVDPRWPLSPRDPDAPAWADVYDKDTEDLKMAVFAAQVDRMDRGIGRIVEKVRASGIADNTLILFLSDNGGCAENLDEGKPGAPIGTPDSSIGCGLPWANLSDTPFRRFKRMAHEGGIATPLIAYWPKVITRGGAITHQVGHIVDLLPTILEASGVDYPKTFDNRPIRATDGLSLLPVLRGGERTGHDLLAWEHEGHRGVRCGKWKLVSHFPGSWELYDLEADRTELNDLAGRMPEKVRELTARYDAWAAECNVDPWQNLPHRARSNPDRVYLENGKPKGPVTIEAGEPQLFVDDWILDSSLSLMRQLHRPVKDDGGRTPVIGIPEGETTLTAKGSILFDPKLNRHVMLAKARPSARIYRYTSPDALTWEASGPIELDDRHPVTGERAERQYAGMHCFFYDTADAATPYKGWIFFGNWGNDHEGVYYISSADGIHWKRGPLVMQAYAGPGDPSAVTIHQDGKTVYGPGDTTRFAYDPVSRRFLGIIKFFTTEPVGPGNGLRSRAYAWLDGLDKPFDIRRLERVALLPAAAEANGDKPDDEYYASTAWRYGPLWLGELLVWHGHDDHPWSAAGCAAVKLVSSRDGLNWSKVPFADVSGTPEIFIPAGPQGGNDGRNDGGYVSLFSQGPLRVGDELLVYYGSSSYGKNVPQPKRLTGGGIFRARLRPEGFVSVTGLMLTTRPLEFAGRELAVNGKGPIIVQALSSEGEVVGTAFLAADSIAHKVRFDGRSLRDVLPDGKGRLRFEVDEGGHLYSFTIR